MFEDCMKFLQEGFSDYKMVDVTEKVRKARNIKVENGKEKSATISASEKYFYPMKKDEIDKLKYEYNLPKSIDAPMKKGSEVGEIKIIFDNDLIFSLKFTTIKDVNSKGILERFFDILNRW